jgi:hypothetical protein
MRLSYTKLCSFFVFFSTIFSSDVFGQQPNPRRQLSIKDFAVYSNGIASSDSTNGVFLRYGSIVNSANGTSSYVGSNNYLSAHTQVTVNGNLYAGTSLRIGNNNTINGNITVNNSQNFPYPVLTANSFNQLGGTNNGGMLNVNGSVFVGTSSTVRGPVYIPPGDTYSGPTPTAGPVSNGLVTEGISPVLPPVTEFPDFGTTDITNTTTLSPGKFRDLSILDSTTIQTIIFSAPGTYIFRSIKNLGQHVFDFKFPTGNTGTYRIYVHEDVELGRIRVQTNGTYTYGNTFGSQIYLETHGTGQQTFNPTFAFIRYAFTIRDAPSPNNCNWVGTVYAPYAGIRVGNLHTMVVDGAFWSGTRVVIGENVQMNHWIFNSSANDVSPYYPPLAGNKTNDLIGSELKSLGTYFDPSSPDTSQNIFLIFPATTTDPAKVMIEVLAEPSQRSALVSYLISEGLTDTITNGAGSLMITGRYPIAKLLTLNTQDHLIRFARPLYQPLTNNGLVKTQGDTAMRSAFVRRDFPVDGDGVKVGVLSDSYNTKPGDPAGVDISNGDLPGVGNPLGNLEPVQLLGDYPFGTRLDEGRAMLQIIHDVAPKAKLAFKTGFISAGDFAEGIKMLADEGCKVIVDDITYITEPFFTDGVVAKAVDNVVTTKGVTYLSSAGNFGIKSYEHNFNAPAAPVALPIGVTALPGTVAHDFGFGQVTQKLFLPEGTYTIVLQWLDDVYSLGGAVSGTVNDLDIYLVKADGSSVLFGYNRNNVGGDPIEVLPFNVTSPTEANLMVVNATGGAGVRFKYIIFRGKAVIAEYNAGTATIVGQANATHALSVGAARYYKTPFYGVTPATLEDFSSHGGTYAIGPARNKPDFVAPDGANTTVQFGSPGFDGDSHPNFYGTSAAAPHAAAVAALLIQGKKKFLLTPTVTPAEIKTLLQTTAVDMGESGHDYASGSGLINAFAAMSSFAQPAPYISSIAPTNVAITPAPNTAPFELRVEGENLTPNTQIWMDATPLATTILGNVATAEIPVFTGNPLIRLKTPPITISGEDGGFSNGKHLIPKPVVRVKANNATKKFGELVPVSSFSSTITRDGVAVTPAEVTSLGLDNLQYQTSATERSAVNKYFIKPLSPHAANSAILNDYEFIYENGELQVTELPIKIVPANKTIKYGQFPDNITYNYEFDKSNMSVFMQNFIVDSIIKVRQKKFIAENGIAVVSRFGDVFPTPGSADAAVANLSTIASFQSVRNSRKFVLLKHQEGGNLTEGVMAPLPPSTIPTNQIGSQRFIIDLDAQSLINYRNDASTAALVESYPGQHKRALISGKALENNTAHILHNGQLQGLVNGQLVGMVNGQLQAIVNGQLMALVNGELQIVTELSFVNGQLQGLVNGQLVGLVNGQLQALVNGQLQPLVNVTEVNGQVVFTVNGQLMGLVNGQLVGMVNGQLQGLVNGQLQGLVNGQLMPMVNGQLQALVNGQLVGLVNGQLQGLVNGQLMAIVNGEIHLVADVRITINGQLQGLVNGSWINLVNGQLQGIVNGQLVGLVNGEVHVVVNVTVVNGQLQGLVNGQLMGMVNGQLQGIVNGQLQGLVNGNDLGEGSSNANAAVIVDEEDVTTQSGQIGAMFGINMVTGLSVGTHKIIPGTFSSENFIVSYGTGTLTINQAPLSIEAHVKYINQGSPLPAFTSTIKGAAYGEAITGVTYSASTVNTSVAGVYTNTPGLPAGTYPSYNKTLIPGSLYVNPFGNNAKQVKVKLECVEAVTGHPSGLKYIAHFSYDNKNSTAYYVPIGVDNNIVSAGTYSGAPPTVFHPGVHVFQIRFDGSKLKWTLTTNDRTKKTASGSEASSSSNRCNAQGAATTSRMGEGGDEASAEVTNDEKPSIISKNSIAPNPVNDVFSLQLRIKAEVKDITILDATGRMVPLRNIRKATETSFTVDASGLKKGIYFVRVNSVHGVVTLRFLKI